MIHVSVAEDDPITARIYAMHFKRHEIAGTFYTSGTDLLTGVVTHRPAVVILDYELPDFSGIEVMQRLHQMPECRTIPVIFVTGRTTSEVEPGLLAAGASAVLGKPFSPTDLIGFIRTFAETDSHPRSS
jgi:CheY-like chemotaxis protein